MLIDHGFEDLFARIGDGLPSVRPLVDVIEVLGGRAAI